jgi:hypothetical protein
MIWPETREFGIGYAYRCGRAVVVARYWPAGNVQGVSPLTGRQADKIVSVPRAGRIVDVAWCGIKQLQASADMALFLIALALARKLNRRAVGGLGDECRLLD